MRRYNITVGALTTVGGKVMTGWEYGSINDQLVAREGDLVFCPACHSNGVIVCTGPHLVETWGGKDAALEGDLCLCKCDPPPTLIANQDLKCQEFDTPARASPRSLKTLTASTRCVACSCMVAEAADACSTSAAFCCVL